MSNCKPAYIFTLSNLPLLCRPLLLLRCYLYVFYILQHIIGSLVYCPIITFGISPCVCIVYVQGPERSSNCAPNKRWIRAAAIQHMRTYKCSWNSQNDTWTAKYHTRVLFPCDDTMVPLNGHASHQKGQWFKHKRGGKETGFTSNYWNELFSKEMSVSISGFMCEAIHEHLGWIKKKICVFSYSAIQFCNGDGLTFVLRRKWQIEQTITDNKLKI